MKKVILILAAVMCAATLLAGCTDNDEESSGSEAAAVPTGETQSASEPAAGCEDAAADTQTGAIELDFVPFE